MVVGAGIFGLSAAMELRSRGYSVLVLDPGPVPHPLASSTDISKVIRMEYGDDAQYLTMAAEAREGWLRWNRLLGETLYHECGLLVLASEPMTPGSFECDSYNQLLGHGFEPQRLNEKRLQQRFPAWKPGRYPDGFCHAKAGYAESARVVGALAKHAQRQGARLRVGSPVTALLRNGSRITGVRTADDVEIGARFVIVAAGVWTPLLVPALQTAMCVVGQPVFHLQCERPELFTPPAFPVFTADISNTGWYGFPLHPREGVIKIANHGIGKPVHPADGERSVDARDHERLRRFLADALPALADAPVVYTRLCLYCDTLDGHFWIDRDPDQPGLIVAAGGSGHGFKFGPLLGGLIADALEETPRPELKRFGWRRLGDATRAEEAARCWQSGWS